MKEKQNIVYSLLVLLCLMVFVGISFDYYYEFNDDVLMKDILSGCYTGTPESHNIQMLWLISAFISICYKVAGALPWYGLFLCGCHYLCIYLIVKRVLQMMGQTEKGLKLGTMAVLLLSTISLYLEHLVFAQYTITVALMAGCACFLFYTEQKKDNWAFFLKANWIAIALLIVAYNIRSEMLLLMLPFVAAAGLVRWGREDHIFEKNNWLSYGLLILAIGIGLLVGQLSHKIAYHTEDWKNFTYLFDERTVLYDYQYVPAYEGNEAFYESIGLSQAEQMLLENYNFGLSPEIDGDILKQVAEYADQMRPDNHLENFVRSLSDYSYQLTHFWQNPYSITVACLYLLAALVLLCRKDKSMGRRLGSCIFSLGSLAFFRSICWLYILYGRRGPDRITHSLYLVEIILLTAFILVEFTGELYGKTYLKLGMIIGLFLLFLVQMPGRIAYVEARCVRQDQLNQYEKAIDTYCKAHPGNFYFEDVYSTIIEGETFNQKMFEDVDNGLKNYDLLGGWFCKSPNYDKKLSQFDIESAEDALINQNHVYLIMQADVSTAWIDAYYEAQSVKVAVHKVDQIGELFGVYQVRKE